MDAAVLAVQSPIVARGLASLFDYLSTILPLTVLRLEDEHDDVDTGLFWSPAHHADAAHTWLRGLIAESLAPYGTASRSARR